MFDLGYYRGGSASVSRRPSGRKLRMDCRGSNRGLPSRYADAVVGMRFDSSEIGESLTEIVAYGTAVVVSQRT